MTAIIDKCNECGYIRYDDDMINVGCGICAAWAEKAIRDLRAEVAKHAQMEAEWTGAQLALRAEVAQYKLECEEWEKGAKRDLKEMLDLRAEVAALTAKLAALEAKHE